MSQRLYQLSGNGNDFLALAEPAKEPSSFEIQSWCRRGISLGTDGVFHLKRQHLKGQRGPDLVVVMQYWNADGKPADLCLNGTRCAAQLAAHLGWCNRNVVLETAAGTIPARVLDEQTVSLDAPLPSHSSQPRRLRVNEEPGTRDFEGRCVTVGVPHFVVQMPSRTALESLDVVRFGRALRWHDAFSPEGSNIDFYFLEAPDHMVLRTFERGVEDETLACGTGMLSTAFACLQDEQVEFPLRIDVRGGFPMRVEAQIQAGEIESWTLEGDARLVAVLEPAPGALIWPGDAETC